ncbi:hypothetical protein L4G92_04925 [Neisseria sp. ZJ106]|uniref:Uncharacterized protein n=1 Tax=Neisseria lisongii TaxID=2912188 RepID=A0ABY7RKT1_9NEIS|nr:hypothetical protein [Neisseria lisongii]MCF7521393.1 hypothetical protein [Neisseria lisongii]WCL71918.1 hypothetical protein PJU73_01980 [Neisseria lisongii]
MNNKQTAHFQTREQLEIFIKQNPRRFLDELESSPPLRENYKILLQDFNNSDLIAIGTALQGREVRNPINNKLMLTEPNVKDFYYWSSHNMKQMQENPYHELTDYKEFVKRLREQELINEENEKKAKREMIKTISEELKRHQKQVEQARDFMMQKEFLDNLDRAWKLLSIQKQQQLTESAEALNDLMVNTEIGRYLSQDPRFSQLEENQKRLIQKGLSVIGENINNDEKFSKTIKELGLKEEDKEKYKEFLADPVKFAAEHPEEASRFTEVTLNWTAKIAQKRVQNEKNAAETAKNTKNGTDEFNKIELRRYYQTINAEKSTSAFESKLTNPENTDAAKPISTSKEQVKKELNEHQEGVGAVNTIANAALDWSKNFKRNTTEEQSQQEQAQLHSASTNPTMGNKI